MGEKQYRGKSVSGEGGREDWREKVAVSAPPKLTARVLSSRDHGAIFPRAPLC